MIERLYIILVTLDDMQTIRKYLKDRKATGVDIPLKLL